MFISSPFGHRFSTVVVVAALVTLSSCSGSETSSAVSTTAVPGDTGAPPASGDLPQYTVVAGDTLSGIASRADVGLDALVSANAWADGSEHLITPGDVIKLPAGAVMSAPGASTAPTAAGTAGSDASSGAPASSGGVYGSPAYAADFNGDRTLPITTPLADGLYYASAASVSGSTVTLTLGQWFACVGTFPETVECPSGFGTLDDPSATVTVASDARVTLATGDRSNFNKAGVGAAEFARLVGGQTPAAGAPTGYSYSGFLMFVQVRNGVAVGVEQIYTS